MRDVRMLTLFRQHFLNDYQIQMNCQYTCWGPYDGLDIEKVNCERESKLFTKMSNAVISNFWYDTGEKVCKLEGEYSGQSIGIFREVADEIDNGETRTFWNNMEYLPFICVGFLKLENPKSYASIAKTIDSYKSGLDRKKEAFCRALSYTTYDNADLIVVLQGNSLRTVQKILEDVEHIPDVKYIYTIMGISWPYLEYISNNQDNIRLWEGTKCFIEEDVARITLQIVSTTENKLIPKLKKILDEWNNKWKIKGYENMSYAHKVGSECTTLLLNDTDVKSLLVFLLPKGFSTHLNVLYGKMIYNIETMIFFNENYLSENGGEIEKQESEETENKTCLRKVNWCKELIKKYSYKVQELGAEDESLRSCVIATIQTLNALAQYEQFGLGQEIFYMVYPAFYMFDKQLMDSLCKKDFDDLKLLKKNISLFLESVNSMVYHMTRVDRLFLMIPLGSETSYSIPTKLVLLYYWFINTVADIFNAPKKENGCILSLNMETRPMTDIIKTKFSSHQRLIWVKLSHRILFNPRFLMLILSHEINHYTGGKYRERAFRMECLIKTLAYHITEAVFPESYEEKAYFPGGESIFQELKKVIRNNLTIKIATYIAGEIKDSEKDKDRDQQYYFDSILTPITICCQQVLSNNVGFVDKIIFTIPDAVQNEIKKQKVDLRQALCFIYNIQRKLKMNRMRVLAENIFPDIIINLIKIYREIFSDALTVWLLECDENEFHEAFQVSEGMLISEGMMPREQQIREEIIHNVYYTFGNDGNKDFQDQDILPIAEEPLKDYLFNYKWVKVHLEKYVDKCKKKIINEELESKEKSKIEKIRNAYNLFRSDKGIEFAEIYNNIVEIIYSYTQDIMEKYLILDNSLQTNYTKNT